MQIGDCTPLRHPSVRELIADAHKLGLFVHVFTFRNEKKYLAADYQADPVQEYLKFFRLGVDGVFTDFTHTGVAARTAYLRELGW
ncbi:glycerophosphodiester phosphodiesterase family protein [Bradyrhizobium sp. CCBAU 53338]|uniref:glycerophosphodiester phosphodiesterase family protein n=1 Tax=Bradyrhizobium sp. CCBAU 53338 TaxID=1325111 RepID=UPI001FEE0779